MGKLNDWLMSFFFEKYYINQKTGEVKDKNGKIVGSVVDKKSEDSKTTKNQ